jgi:hypothetical protein
VAKPSRSVHFVSIALRASNVLRLVCDTAALHRHPAKHAAVSGCAHETLFVWTYTFQVTRPEASLGSDQTSALRTQFKNFRTIGDAMSPDIHFAETHFNFLRLYWR